MKRKATAVWHGSGMEGSGLITTQSNVLNNTQLSFKSRFENGIGTNPEELLAASHAGCFTMKLAFVLNEAGYTAEKLETTAIVSLENGSITSSHLEVNAIISNIPNQVFEDSVKDAKENCPISKVINASISVTSNLAN
ncbi:OsmC family peroxiredoxin [Flavobacterium sp. XS2P12]|uniref:OsmC family peroxiredoxin n=1 Tax=Flavobacterium melibiosi TaxID=3398734 RepID=UPI003A854D4A